MSMKQKIIQVTDQQAEWIEAQVGTGRFVDDDDYIRSLLRADQDNREQDEKLRAALLQGEASGEAQVFDSKAFKARMKAKYG